MNISESPVMPIHLIHLNLQNEQRMWSLREDYDCFTFH